MRRLIFCKDKETIRGFFFTVPDKKGLIYESNEMDLSSKNIYHQKQIKTSAESNTKTDTIFSLTVHHVPKCMSCHKAIVVIAGRAHFFHDNIYIMLVLLLWDLSTLFVMKHLSPTIYIICNGSLVCLLFYFCVFLAEHRCELAIFI